MKMNMRKNRFWTLSRQAGGFTLVELIVVIAILAILAGVGIPVYSGYITRANKQADMTLVSDVANALQLYYYSHSAEKPAGFVVLNSDGSVATADDAGVGAAAMEAAFGANWAETAKLKFSNWTTSGILDIVANYTDAELSLIASSSYLTTSTPASLMHAVTGLTGMANVVISDRVDDLDEAIGHLNTIFGDDSDIVAKLEDLEVTDSDDYTTMISNMLVNQMSSAIASEPVLQEMVNLYAAAYAYGEATGKYGAYEAMTAKLESVDLSILSSNTEGDGFAYLTDNVLDPSDPEHFAFMCYMDPSADPDYVAPENGEDASTKFMNDMAALGTMMGAVQHVSGEFMDKESLLNGELFTSEGIMDQVNSYYNSIKSLADMSAADRAALKNMPDGTVVVFVAADGSVSAVPNTVWSTT